MKSKIKILHLEDLPADAELVARELKKAHINFEMEVVANKVMFKRALKNFSHDVILSDHSVGSFDSHEALKLVKEAHITAPFILVTATMKDEFAAKVMKDGATDYIIKDRLHRLPSAVINSIEKHHLEEEKEAAHDRLGFHIENTRLGFIEWDIKMHVKVWSKRAEEIFGWNEQEFIEEGYNVFSHVYKEDLLIATNMVRDLIKGIVKSNNIQYRHVTKDGGVIWCEWFNSVLKNKEGKVVTIMSLVQDITGVKVAEAERIKMVNDLIQRNKDLEQFTYIISHNLRAPVANILAIAHLLNEQGLSSEEKVTLSEGLTASVTGLDNVVKDLNYIIQSKVDSKKEIKRRICFSDLVADVSMSIQNLIDDNNIEIQSDFREVDCFSTLKSYLYSIFFNLIVNSIKYRQQNIPCIIAMKSRLINNKIELTFTDNGMGIDLKKKGNEVFGLYKRFHPAIEGKGMGLFMVKTQVESLGGTISLTSHVNEGTEFKIELDNS